MRLLILATLMSIGTLLTAQSKPQIYVFMAEKCPVCIYMTNPLQQVLDVHENNAEFYAVFPVRTSSLKTARKFLKENALDALTPMIDSDQSYSKSFDAKVTPEVVVMLDDELKYKGRISDAYRAPGKMKHGKRSNDLLHVLNILKENPAATFTNHNAIGCFITYHAK